MLTPSTVLLREEAVTSCFGIISLHRIPLLDIIILGTIVCMVVLYYMWWYVLVPDPWPAGYRIRIWDATINPSCTRA